MFALGGESKMRVVEIAALWLARAACAFQRAELAHDEKVVPVKLVRAVKCI